MKIYIITLVALFMFFSCKNTEVKKVIESYTNGQEKLVRYYKSKKDTLNYREEKFYSTGEREYVGHIISNEKEDGVWIWWYKNGKKKDQCKYHYGINIDTIYHWYDNGQLQQLEIVNDQRKRTDTCCSCNGTIIRYNEYGKLIEQFTNIDGKRNGIVIRYVNGNYRMETYKNDTLNGPTIEKYYKSDSTEIITIKGQYKNGKETGLWKRYKDSVLTGTLEYDNGKIIKSK